MTSDTEYHSPEDSPVWGASIQMQNLGPQLQNAQDTMSTGSAVSIRNRLHALMKI